MLRQNILLTNANKSNVYNLNNSISLNFPTNLFFKPPQFIELLDMDLNAEINVLGYSNNTMYVIYKNKRYLILISFEGTLKSDYQLSKALEQGLNNPRNPLNPSYYMAYDDNLSFKVTDSSIENIVTNHYIERESFTVAFTIDCTDTCTLDFSNEDSIGPLMGFGNGIYENTTNIAGTSTQSLSAYNYIDVINSSGSTDSGLEAGPFPNYNDVNCKMILYDSNQRIIPNIYKKFDTAISLNQGKPLVSYESLGEILMLIEDQMNLYKNYFTPTANFIVSYDNITKKVSIKNTTGAKFGIGFDFSNYSAYRVMASTDAIIWTGWMSDYIVPLNNWTSITSGYISGSNLIVAVASSGIENRVMTSIDGTKWVSRDSPHQAYWSSIAGSSNMIVAIASEGSKNLLTSIDGSNWISSNLPVNNKWNSIIWVQELNMFIAVSSSGTGNRVITSADGLTWTSRSSAADNEWRSIAWAPELNLLVAVSSSGTNNRVMTSPDGINWTSRTSATNNNWTSITWGGITGQKRFIAVASSGTNNRIMTSTNGIAWSSITSPADNNWTSVCWSSTLNLFVAIASSGTNNRIMTSPDGLIWTLRTSPIDENWSSIIWISKFNKFLITSSNSNSNKMLISSNGITWTSYTLPFNYNWRSINFINNNLYTAGLTIGKSIDSYIWNNYKFLVDNDWTSVCWSSDLNLFITVAKSGINDRIAYSQNGIEWISAISPADNNWTSVCWSSELMLFVAISNSGIGNRVMSSSDGINWTLGTTSADNDWTSICWSSNLNLFVAVASSGTNRVMVSSNGVIWTLKTSPNNNWMSVTWGGISGQEKFVAVASSGTNNRIMTSSDGNTWISRTSPADNEWVSICWTELNKFVAVANTGLYEQIMYSDDGITWTTTEAEINLNWNAVTWVGNSLNKVITVGGAYGNTSGSLHYILGFEQKSYIDVQEITSINDLLCFDNIFADDYVLICSDIINNATDINVIGIGNANNIKSNNILFAIPLSQSKHFRPIDSSYYKINISSSQFSLGYKNKKFNSSNPNFVKFYLRLLSGRHITSTSQFTMQLSFLF